MIALSIKGEGEVKISKDEKKETEKLSFTASTSGFDVPSAGDMDSLKEYDSNLME